MSARSQQYWNDPIIEKHVSLEEKIAELSPVIAYVYYPESNKIKYLNGKIMEMLGYDYHEIGLSELFNIISTEDHDIVKEGLSKIHSLRDNESCNYQCHYKHKDNTERYFNTKGTVLTRNTAGEPTSLLFVAHDITGLVSAKPLQTGSSSIDQQVLINELERSNRELEEFAYAAAHDMQEPLRKIFKFSERLRNKTGIASDKDSSEYLDRILATTDNMRTLIDSLLDFSRLVHSESLFELTNMNILLEEARSEADQKLSDASISFHYDRLPKMEVARAEMRQLFINLFSNAIKFQRTGTEPVITVKYHKMAADEKDRLSLPRSIPYCKITVEDNGIGFENEFAEKIFQPFQRLHGKAEFPGSGIGLALCRKIVEHHRGIIYARSNPGNGATFTIILPERQMRPV